MKFVISHPLVKAGMDLLEKYGAEVYIANSTKPEEYLEHIQEADAVIIRLGQFREELIKQCPNLKAIGRTGVGYDNVDVSAAAKMGIPTVFTPGANQRSVAEHAIAMMFSLSKALPDMDAETRKGNWMYRDSGRSHEIIGKKIGIIGTGRIGREVAAIARGLGMQTAGFDLFGKDFVEAAGCEYYDNIDDLCRDCDVISLHCQLTESTKNLISKKQLELMKKDAIVINCARGPIVNEEDLAWALNNDKIAGAGLDVFWEEPANLDSPVFKAKNVIVTPHIAALSNEALDRMATQCVEGCVAVIKGEEWKDVVDKTAYEHPHFKDR